MMSRTGDMVIEHLNGLTADEARHRLETWGRLRDFVAECAGDRYDRVSPGLKEKATAILAAAEKRP